MSSTSARNNFDDILGDIPGGMIGGMLGGMSGGIDIGQLGDALQIPEGKMGEIMIATFEDMMKKKTDHLKNKIYNFGPIKPIKKKYDNLSKKHKSYVQNFFTLIYIIYMIYSIINKGKKLIYMVVFAFLIYGGMIIYGKYIKN